MNSVPLVDPLVVLLPVTAILSIVVGWLLANLTRRDNGAPAGALDPERPPSLHDDNSGAGSVVEPISVTGLVETDPQGRIIGLDDVAAALLGNVPVGAEVGEVLPSLIGGQDDQNDVRRDIHESRVQAPNGSVGDVDLMVSPRPDGSWLIAVRDAGPRKQRLRKLERLALHDPLTELPNRVLFADRTEQALALAERRDEPCAVLMLDLDRFKQVNDTLGHDIGDLLLREVGPRLLSPLRRTDTLARLGGDEFAVLLPPPTSAEEAVEVARRLVQSMRRHFLIDGFSLDVGVSVGVALHAMHGSDLDSLLRSADEAMYAAKRNALGYLLAGQPPDLGVLRRPALRADLERAIADRALTLHFQPKVEAGSRRVTGFEGLLRWDHPSYGRLQPSMFLDVAERARLMGPLTQFVLTECLRHQQEWRREGHHLEVSVNLATMWLRDEQLIEHVTQVIQAHGTRASDLTLEVTEGSIMADPEYGIERLRQLRGLGCRIAMDDFGTGYSSLAHLQRLPLDEIKIHRSFVAPLERDSTSASVIFRSIIGIAQGLGLATTAEGVETAAVAEAVTALGCERLQGFLIAAPMEADDATRWLGRAVRDRRTTVGS